MTEHILSRRETHKRQTLITQREGSIYKHCSTTKRKKNEPKHYYFKLGWRHKVINKQAWALFDDLFWWCEWNSCTQVSTRNLKSHIYLFSPQRTAKQALHCFNRSSCDRSSLYSKLPGCGCVVYHCTLFFFVTAQHHCTYLCRYSLEWHVDSDSCFDIDTVEGTISTNDYLDRETALQHNITVLATKVSKYPGRKTSSLEKGLLSS